MKIVVNTLPGPEASLADEIRRIVPVANVVFVDGAAATSREIADADVLAGYLDERGLKLQRKLGWIHSWAAGPETQLYPAFVASGIPLTCSKGNGAAPLAEHAMLLMLMLNRSAVRWLDSQKSHVWDRYVHGELGGLTCGIVGMGHAGTDLARRAKAFDMTVLGLRRTAVAGDPCFDATYSHDGIDDFVAQCDFVVVTAPRTPQSVGLLGEAQFRRMKNTAFYICVSRGGIADDDALLWALRDRWIAGAGLDAHSVEPLPHDSPFWTAPNTIITPHNGALTLETAARGRAIFLDNLLRFAARRPLANVVDVSSGY